MKKLFLVCFSLSLVFNSICQIYQPTAVTTYGVHVNRNKPDSVQHVPYGNDTLLRTSDSSAQIRVINGRLKYHWGIWHDASSGGTPSGSAGGDLLGTYPSPTVSWPNGYSTYDTRYAGIAGVSNPFAIAGQLTVTDNVGDNTASAPLVLRAKNTSGYYNEISIILISPTGSAASSDAIRIPAVHGTVVLSVNGSVPDDNTGNVVIPTVPLGSSNQILGMNSAGTATEYKTFSGSSGIVVTNVTGGVNITAPVILDTLTSHNTRIISNTNSILSKTSVSNFVDGEEVASGTSSTYTLSYTPVINTLEVYRNGVRLPKSFFSLSGSVVTLVYGRESIDVISNNYIK